MHFAELPKRGKLAYEIHGAQHAGTPLLLLRPLGGSIALWEPFRARLAQHVRVISFDHRGTGHSSGDPAVVTTRGLARDARALLDVLAIERAHVFGISLGGMTATWLAIDAPARVDKLCIACAPTRGSELTHGLRRELAMAASFFRPGSQVESALVLRVLSHRFRDTHPSEVERIARVVAQTPSSRVGLLRHVFASLMHAPGAKLSRIAARTLVLAGDHDALLGVEPVRELARVIPHAQFDVIADSGHDLSLEQPVRTAERVLRFVGVGGCDERL